MKMNDVIILTIELLIAIPLGALTVIRIWKDMTHKTQEKIKKIETEATFIVVDLCAWERNKLAGRSYPHSIGVVDEKTGQLRYIKSGSRIKFLHGEMSEGMNQETYNKIA